MKWTLYAVYFLLVMVLQSVALPLLTIGGIALCIVPISVVCISVHEGVERGALFALIAGIVYCLSGVDCGPIHIITLTLSAVLAGALCDRYYTRSFMPALFLSLLGLAVCESIVFLFRVYIGVIDPALWQTVLLPEILFSALGFPPLYLGVWVISRIGR